MYSFRQAGAQSCTASASRPAKEADPGSAADIVNLSLDSCCEGAFDVQRSLLNLVAFPAPPLPFPQSFAPSEALLGGPTYASPFHRSLLSHAAVVLP